MSEQDTARPHSHIPSRGLMPFGMPKVHAEMSFRAQGQDASYEDNAIDARDDIPIDDIPILDIETARAEAAIRNFAAALCYADGASKESNSKAIRAAASDLKGVFGRNVRIYFHEREKFIGQDVPMGDPGFARLQIHKVTFIDKEGGRSGLNLDGLRAPILLRIWDCNLWYLHLYNAKLFALDLYRLRSAPPPSCPFPIRGHSPDDDKPLEKGRSYDIRFSGTWLAALGLELTQYFDVRDCAFSVFVTPGLKASRLRFDGEVSISAGGQLASESLKRLEHVLNPNRVIFLDPTKFNDDATRKAFSAELNATEYQAISQFRVSMDVSNADVGEIYINPKCLAGATFRGTRVSASFYIEDGIFCDPIFEFVPEQTTSRLEKKNGAPQETTDPLEPVLRNLCNLNKLAEKAGSGLRSALAPVNNAIKLLREYHRTPVIDFSDLRVNGKLALLQLGERASQLDNGSDLDLVLLSHGRHRVTGYVDFTGARCLTFSDDDSMWDGRENDPTLCFGLSFFEYQYLEVAPISSKDPYFNAGGPQTESGVVLGTGLRATRSQTIGGRKAEWLRSAFRNEDERKHKFDAQPWTQCAFALRRSGKLEDADHVLYERELRVRELHSESISSQFLRTLVFALPFLLFSAVTTLFFSPISAVQIAKSIEIDEAWALILVTLSFSGAFAFGLWLAWDTFRSNASRNRTPIDRSGTKYDDCIPDNNDWKHSATNTQNRGVLENLGNRLLSLTIGFGYKPWRIVTTGFATLLLGAVIFYNAETSGRFASKPGPEFNIEDEESKNRSREAVGRSSAYSVDFLDINSIELDGNTVRTYIINGKNQRTCCTSLPKDEIEAAVEAGMTRALESNTPGLASSVESAVHRGVKSAIADSASSIKIQANPLLFSLNRMFPVLDLIVGSEQIPRTYIKKDKTLDWSQFFLWCYYWLHSLIGLWIAAVVVGYVTGLLERRE